MISKHELRQFLYYQFIVAEDKRVFKMAVTCSSKILSSCLRERPFDFYKRGDVVLDIVFFLRLHFDPVFSSRIYNTMCTISFYLVLGISETRKR